MEKYNIEIRKSAAKEIENLPKKDIKAVLKKIASLAENPRQNGAQKLSGQEKYRIRCGNYRILYSIQDNMLIVYIVKVGHRKDVYREHVSN
jgi:mRNA interferase RelE/StbE